MRPVSRAVRHTLERHGVRQGEVSVLLTSDDEIRRLNHEFRHVNEATDVLTFVGPDLPFAPIGDIVISLDAAWRQAKAHGHSPQAEVEILAMHGALHLAGLDDETPEDYAAMMQAMGVLASELDLPWTGQWMTLKEGQA